ncbi:Phospholipase A and acyltransferase 3 [Bulinus truncatus]|nr:Phospholipase A and acyltransferase 3 [Bulinus truncatus]
MASPSHSDKHLVSRIRARNDYVLRFLQPGDLVKIDRHLYYHWGVYIGDRKIIHITKERPLDKSCGEIREDDLLKVAGKSKIYVGNDRDKRYKPRNPEKVVKKAKLCIGSVDYNLVTRNCEHFANYCRYGQRVSEQILFLGSPSKELEDRSLHSDSLFDE